MKPPCSWAQGLEGVMQAGAVQEGIGLSAGVGSPDV